MVGFKISVDSGHGLNNGPFNDGTDIDCLNIELVRYSDPHKTLKCKCTSFISKVTS